MRMREFESKKVWEGVGIKTTWIPNMSYSFWTITHRGIKWWANECDIVAVIEHESVIPRECETLIVWGKFCCCIEVVLDIPL